MLFPIGFTIGEHSPRHCHRQRDAWPVLRAHRVYGKRRGGSENPVHRQNAEGAGRQKADAILDQNDRVGQPFGISCKRHQVSAQGDQGFSTGGHRHLPGPHFRHPV